MSAATANLSPSGQVVGQNINEIQRSPAIIVLVSAPEPAKSERCGRQGARACSASRATIKTGNRRASARNAAPRCQFAARAAARSIVRSAKFCDECGGRLGEATDAGEPQATDAGEARAPHTYTPRYLAEKILTTRSALEGERKLVTVLFADIADSSALAQELDAEQLHLLMDRVLQLAADAVHRYEGTVNSYLGDGMMALFGAPIALEDHAVRAVHAALTHPGDDPRLQ